MLKSNIPVSLIDRNQPTTKKIDCKYPYGYLVFVLIVFAGQSKKSVLKYLSMCAYEYLKCLNKKQDQYQYVPWQDQNSPMFQ